MRLYNNTFIFCSERAADNQRFNLSIESLTHFNCHYIWKFSDNLLKLLSIWLFSNMRGLNLNPFFLDCIALFLNDTSLYSLEHPDIVIGCVLCFISGSCCEEITVHDVNTKLWQLVQTSPRRNCLKFLLFYHDFINSVVYHI